MAPCCSPSNFIIFYHVLCYIQEQSSAISGFRSSHDRSIQAGQYTSLSPRGARFLYYEVFNTEVGQKSTKPALTSVAICDGRYGRYRSNCWNHQYSRFSTNTRSPEWYHLMLLDVLWGGVVMLMGRFTDFLHWCISSSVSARQQVGFNSCQESKVVAARHDESLVYLPRKEHTKAITTRTEHIEPTLAR